MRGSSRVPRFVAPAAAAVIAVALAVGLAACGGSGGPAQPSPTCTPNGTSLSIVAQNQSFNRSCLAAPANERFTIALVNQDSGVPHNISIYKTSTAGTALFKGPIFVGPATQRMTVHALPPGTYYFQCDVHPDTMNGTLVVR
jgi:plastocyanin